MKKAIITLWVISFILMFSTASGAEKSDSLFMRYEAVYPAFRPIVDSLLDGCPKGCAYIMDLHRNTGSERTQILVQRFEYHNAGLFDTTDCYGVISDENNFIYLYCDKEYDLLSPTGEYIAAASCGCPVYTPEYVSDNGAIKFACQYFMKNGNEVHAVKHQKELKNSTGIIL